jgi:hypothetical protein
MTKDFIEKETVSKTLMDNGSDQLGIRLKFDIDKASYEFESSYWISSREPNVNPNLPVKNDYKTWYLNINGIFQEKLEF